jgi:hypothetical protein
MGIPIVKGGITREKIKVVKYPRYRVGTSRNKFKGTDALTYTVNKEVIYEYYIWKFKLATRVDWEDIGITFPSIGEAMNFITTLKSNQ